MKNTLLGLAAGLLTTLSLSGIAVAQNIEEVTVKASRITTEKVGQSNYGVPIVEISLSYHVSHKDLDLGTSAGAAMFEARVTKAAQDACKEIDAKYPTAQPSNEKCTKAAVKEALVKVREAVAAAGKASAK
jgi:UrcA family protein